MRVCVEEKEKALRGLEETSRRLEMERIQEKTHLVTHYQWISPDNSLPHTLSDPAAQGM